MILLYHVIEPNGAKKQSRTLWSPLAFSRSLRRRSSFCSRFRSFLINDWKFQEQKKISHLYHCIQSRAVLVHRELDVVVDGRDDIVADFQVVFFRVKPRHIRVLQTILGGGSLLWVKNKKLFDQVNPVDRRPRRHRLFNRARALFTMSALDHCLSVLRANYVNVGLTWLNIKIAKLCSIIFLI